MLQTTPTRCLRAAANPLSFTSQNQSVMIRVTYAAQPHLTSSSTRQLSTTILRPRQLCSAKQQKPITAVEYCLSKSPLRLSAPSTTARRNATTAAAATPSSRQSTTTTLTWNRFLALRKTRRKINLVCSIATAGGATVMGIGYLSTSDFDQWAAKTTGMDPFIVLGLSTFGFMGVGWLMGPIIGAPVFNTLYRSVVPEFRAKESDFFKRIQRNRADVSNASIQNPPPDYYGEKIGSVHDYRTWLRDQRAYRLKRGRAA